MAPAGCHTHRHASRDSYYNIMNISYITDISFIIHHNLWPYHITKHLLQKQVRRPLIVVASFTWLLRAEQEPFLHTHQKPQRGIVIAF